MLSNKLKIYDNLSAGLLKSAVTLFTITVCHNESVLYSKISLIYHLKRKDVLYESHQYIVFHFRVLYGNKIVDLPHGVFNGLSSLQLL